MGVEPIKVYYNRMKENGVSRAIIVVPVDGVTGMVQEHIKILEDTEGYRIETFKETELLFDITEHRLVPDHSLLTDQEKKDLLAKYKLKETQLPRIKKSDPVARYLGLSKGHVVRITRPSETAGLYVTYRLVDS